MFSDLCDFTAYFLENIPDDFKEDILTDTFGGVIKGYHTCKTCFKTKHESKFTSYLLKKDTPTFLCSKCRKEKAIEGAAYDLFKDRLTPDEEPKEGDNGKLLVRCKYCREYFNPTKIQVYCRIQALNSFSGEANLYCSEDCKDKCPLYRSHGTINTNLKRDQNYISQANRLALERAGYKCEICEAQENLEVHHIVPFKVSPIEAYDLDNLIVLCRTHHKEYGHSLSGCRLQDIRSC